MAIDEQTLRHVVMDVCSGILGLKLEPASDPTFDGHGSWSALIRISGRWESLLQVIVSREIAVAIASDMFAAREDELCEAEIHDAVGEMVSIIGGNLREKTEGASRLSLPCVSQRSVDGLCSHFFVGWSVANRCRGGLLIVRLLDFHAAGSVTLS